MAIIVSGNVLELKSARSQSAIAHIMSCSSEPKKYFLGRKTQISQIRLVQTNPRRIQTLPPMPLLVMYMTLNRLKGCCQLQHLVYSRGFISITVVETQRVKFTVCSEPNNGDFVFPECIC